MNRVSVQTVTIAQSATLSEAFPLGQAIAAMLHVPAVDSCSLLLKHSFDQTSANFKPVRQVAPTSGNLVLQTAGGSMAVPLPMDMMAGGYAKVECSVPMSNAAIFQIVVRF